MTLVLPYGPDQIGNTTVFSGSARNSNMPCVFDGEALDFESALMTDWNSDINVYETSSDDFSTRSPSDSTTDLKRKLSTIGNDAQQQQPTHQPKKPRTDVIEDLLVSPLQSGVVSSSSSSSSSSSCESSSSCSSSTASSSSSDGGGGQEDDASSSSTHEDEDYVPRRRGPQMWNSRQRWKDERKRVLKLSLAKLAEIEDPEVCMHRSVVINNTVRRLHADIKNERQAKLRQKQQRMDLYNERFQSASSSSSSLEQQRFGVFESSGDDLTSSSKLSLSADTFDDSSCDEMMFGISEDFLRVTIPDRRVPTPIPTQSPTDDRRQQPDVAHSPMDTSPPPVVAVTTSQPTSCYSNSRTTTTATTITTATTTDSVATSSCDTAMDSASSSSLPSSSLNNNARANSDSNSSNSNSASSGCSQQRRGGVVSNSNSGSQCATQYRTSRDASSEHSFPPRVPILDSVVYHSLLASLESS